MEVAKYILIIPLAMIYYKDGMHKINNIYEYYLLVSNFNISKSKKYNKFFTSLLISLDLTISLGILIVSTRIIICILGIILEIFYLITMLCNYKQKFKDGCNCYIINATEEVHLIDIFKIISIIFVFNCILII